MGRNPIAMAAAALTLLFAAQADAYIYAGGTSGSINRANNDGTGVAALATGTGGIDGIAVDSTYLYWLDRPGVGGIWYLARTYLDGSGADLAYIALGPADVAYDGLVVDGTYAYWGDPGNHSIVRARLDKSAAPETSFITGVNSPTGLALSGSTLYWANGDGNKVGRATLNGTAAASGVDQAFVTTGGLAISGVAVDGTYVYWADSGDASIGRAELADPDGTANPEQLSLGSGDPGDVFVFSSYLLWGDGDPGNPGVGRATRPDLADATRQFVVTNRTFSVTADALTTEAPALSPTGTARSYTENDAATAIDTGITVTDPNSVNLTSATITLTSPQSGDELAYSTTAGISGSVNVAKDTVTLSGTGTLASYESALRAVTFRNTSDDPSTTARTVTFKVKDATNVNSNVATRTIDVSAIDDAPVLATTSSALGYTAGAAAATIDPGVTVADVDNANLSGATIDVTGNFAAGEDVLAFSDQNGITGSYTASSGVLALTGTATVAQYQAALRSITYRGTNPAPAAATKTVRLRVSDGSLTSTGQTRTIALTRLPSGGTPSFAGTRRSGQTLTVDPGTWASSTGVTFAYRWQRDTGGGFFDIAGATAATYVLTDDDTGHDVRVHVTATNADGSAQADSASGTVRAALGALSISSGPSGSTTDTSASFAFGGEDGVTFECKLDGGGFADCASPRAFSGLAVGDHTFSVRQRDGATSVSGAATRTWTIIAPPPPPPAQQPQPAAQPTEVTPPAQPQTSVGTGGSLTVPCTIDAGSLETCAVDAFADDAARRVTVRAAARVLIGHGEATAPARGATTVMVTVVLNERGKALLAKRPAGLTVSVELAAKPFDSTTVLHTTATTVLKATTFTVVPAQGQFAAGSAKLTAAAKRQLTALVMSVGKVSSVRCEGHTDSREAGREPARRALGLSRAKAVCAQLRRLGFATHRSVRSFGSKKPKAKNTSARNRARNRRVELVVTR